MNQKIDIQENTLIRKCRRGDAKAQFEIYRIYYKGMYNVSLRILNNSVEAEDVMQEAFLSAFAKIKTFTGEVCFGGWLKRIVVNRSLDALRKRKVQLEEIDERTTAIEEDGDDRGEDAVWQVERVKKLVAQMSDVNRLLITLHLFEGYTHEEIADILDMKHGAVRTGYSRARKKLQEALSLEETRN